MKKTLLLSLVFLFSCSPDPPENKPAPQNAPAGHPALRASAPATNANASQESVPRGKPTPEEIEAHRAGFKPRFSLDGSKDEAILEFVEGHQGEEIPSLGISHIAGDSKAFSFLKRLKGLRSLTLSGTWTAEPIRESANPPYFIFKTALSDDAVREIAAIGSLRAIWIWYGSISEPQKELLRTRIPEIKFHDNLNKN